jgi:hypothetical protein
MRIRTVKPEFFADDDVADLSLSARLLFVGLLLVADREGRLEDRPRLIKGRVFPHDAIECEPLLGELAAKRFILRYTVEHKALIQIRTFEKHQRPHPKEQPSVLPGLEKVQSSRGKARSSRGKVRTETNPAVKRSVVVVKRNGVAGRERITGMGREGRGKGEKKPTATTRAREVTVDRHADLRQALYQRLEQHLLAREIDEEQRSSLRSDIDAAPDLDGLGVVIERIDAVVAGKARGPRRITETS